MESGDLWHSLPCLSLIYVTLFSQCYICISKVFGLPEAQLLEVNYLKMQMISVQKSAHSEGDVLWGTKKGHLRTCLLADSTVLCSPLSFCGVITYLQEARLLKAFIHLSLIIKMFKDIIKAIKRKGPLPVPPPFDPPKTALTKDEKMPGLQNRGPTSVFESTLKGRRSEIFFPKLLGAGRTILGGTVGNWFFPQLVKSLNVKSSCSGARGVTDSAAADGNHG